MDNKLEYLEARIAGAWSFDDAEKIMTASIEFRHLLSDPEFRTNLIEKFAVSDEGSIELLRSKEHGFILTAYAEMAETYRHPHNHGAGWVIYGVVTGKMKMRTFQPGQPLLLSESLVLTPEEFKVYLRGQIHDTTGVAEKSLVLRFTSCDLKKEEAAGRMIRFPAVSCSYLTVT